MKPGHRGGYTAAHATLCERTLVTLLRGLGPWKGGVYLIGGLVPRYLVDRPIDPAVREPHAGTTDVDLVLDLAMLAEVETYRRLETNLRALGFVRGSNDAGQAQHFSWRKPLGAGVTIVVDLLCDAEAGTGGRVVAVAGERRLSALATPGARLAIADHVPVPLTAELLDDAGVATATIRVAGIVPFLVLKALAFEDRNEPKDAYDLIYCLTYYREGPAAVGAAFAEYRRAHPDEPLLPTALGILRGRFATDADTPGWRKNGPAQYARFLTDPGQPGRDAVNRRHAAATVALLLEYTGEGATAEERQDHE